MRGYSEDWICKNFVFSLRRTIATAFHFAERSRCVGKKIFSGFRYFTQISSSFQPIYKVFQKFTTFCQTQFGFKISQNDLLVHHQKDRTQHSNTLIRLFFSNSTVANRFLKRQSTQITTDNIICTGTTVSIVTTVGGGKASMTSRLTKPMLCLGTKFKHHFLQLLWNLVAYWNKIDTTFESSTNCQKTLKRSQTWNNVSRCRLPVGWYKKTKNSIPLSHTMSSD